MGNFIKEYKNYIDSPINIREFGNISPVGSYASAPFPYKGKQTTVTICTFTQNDPYQEIGGGININSIPNRDLYGIRVKNEDAYFIFSTRGTDGIGIYFNTKPSSSGGTYLMGSSGDPYKDGTMAMVLWDGWLFLNSQKWSYSANRLTVGNLGLHIPQLENTLGDIDFINFSENYGSASDSGGYKGGSFDNSSDIISIPTKPTIGVSNIGFVNVYCPTQNALVNLGSELFPDFTPPPTPPTSTDVATALQMGLNNVVDNISNFTNMFINSKLIDYVIDCHCIPIKPSVTESENIKIGFKSFSPTAPKSTTDYVDFDCGTLNIKEYYSNFIDYVGTRAKLYLPFIGFVPIENEYFQNGVLQVIYRFNIIDGSFMAYVLSSSSKSELKNSVIASYGGNACIHIPITGLNYSNMVSGLASGTVATIATASINKGLGAITAVNSALNTLSSKPSMQSSNGYNSTSAYLGIRYPYLIIEREVSNFSELYTNENGLPCNITKKIIELSGFVQMDNVHMETLPCMEEEKEMIQSLLSSGIIV